ARTETWQQPGAAGRRVEPLFGLLAGGARFVIEQLRGLIAAEAAQTQLLPWIAVTFGAGAVIYFTAEREPVAYVVAPLAALVCLTAFLLRRSKFFPAAVLAAALCAGFTVATLRTAGVAHNVLTRPLYSVALSGFVEVREERERSDRFVLRVTRMED